MQQSNQMTAMTAEGFGDEIEFNTKPLASLSVAYSRQLDYLSGNNFKSLSVEDLIQLLKVMKKYSSDQTLKLQDQLSDLSIKKVISIDRSKDNKGNFAYAVKSENAGKQDYIFPETLNFTVPIFANNEKLVIDLEFEFIFKYAINDGGVKLQFSISNLTIWDDVILKAKEMVKEKFQSLQKAEIVVHYGRNKIEQHTDKDMYLITPLY